MMREVDFGLIYSELDVGGGKSSVKPSISKSQVVNASSAHDGMLTIKIGEEITNATYSIQSKDLIINFADDYEILVLKYLSQARVPSLVSDTGRFISRDTIFTLTRFDMSAKPSPEVAGYVTGVEGKAYVKRITGVKGELAEGDTVHQGDYFATPGGSSLQIKLADGSEYKIEQSSRVTLDAFAFSSKPDLHRSVLSVLNGSLTFKGGDISRHPAGEAVIHTPVAILGMKGEIAGGWRVDEDGTHKFFAECSDDVCNGKLEIRTMAGERGLYQPNIFIAVQNMMKVPTQLTNLETPRAMSMGEVAEVQAIVEESPAVESASEPEVIEAVVEAKIEPAEPLAQAVLEAPIEQSVEENKGAKKESVSAASIPAVDFFGGGSGAEWENPIAEAKVIEVASEVPAQIEEATKEAIEEVVEAKEEATKVTEVEEPAAVEEKLEAILPEPTSVQEAPEEVVEILTAPEPVQEVAPESEAVVEAALEAVSEEPVPQEIKLPEIASKETHMNGHEQHVNGKTNGHAYAPEAAYRNGDGYFHAEKTIEVSGIDYDKLKIEKSGDGEDLVLRVINGTPTSGHIIVLKRFFSSGVSAGTALEIAAPPGSIHKAN